jgi:hypothetical protein
LHFCLVSPTSAGGITSKIGASRMNIRFVSTLTAEDEANFAPALLRAVGSLLDQLPIAYTVRIETSGDQVFQHSHPAVDGHYTDAFDATALGSPAMAKP